MSLYHKKIQPKADGTIDLFRIARAYGIVEPAQFAAMKKVMMAGKRGSKGPIQDIDEAIEALQELRDMIAEDLTSPASRPAIPSVPMAKP